MVRSRTRLRLLAVLVAFGLVVAACGNDDSDNGAVGPTTTTSTTVANGSNGDDDTPDDLDPQGTLVLGADLTSTGAGIFDTAEQPVVLNIYQEWLFGTLLRMTPSGEVVPDLAESVEIIDPSTVTVTLRPGLVFTDDTPVDAEALKSSWERTIATEVQGGIEAEFRAVEEITIDGPLTVTAHLSQPIAGAWVRLLRLAEGSPISPTAIASGVDLNANPVGAGPYTLEAYEAGTRQVFVKNPKYWDADNILIPRIEVIQVTADALTNAIRSNTIDRAALTSEQAREMQGVQNWEVITRADEAISLIGHTCKNRPPFDDIRVRQAVNFATDRDALNQAMYGGEGSPMWGFHPEGHPFFNPEVKDYYAFDLDKARELLAEAGYNESNPLAFDLLYGNQRASEIIEQQWAQAGIDVTLKQLTAVGDFFPDAAAGPMFYFELMRTGTPKVTRNLVPGSFGNVCGWDDPELNQIMTDLQGIDESSPEGIALWKAASRNAVENAVHAFGLFGVRSYAHNTERLGNIEYYADRFGTPMPYLHGMYIKK